MDTEHMRCYAPSRSIATPKAINIWVALLTVTYVTHRVRTGYAYFSLPLLRPSACRTAYIAPIAEDSLKEGTGAKTVDVSLQSVSFTRSLQLLGDIGASPRQMYARLGWDV